MLTRLIPYPPLAAEARVRHAGHFTDPLPGARPWVQIDGLMIRGWIGRTEDGHIAEHAYICGLDHGSKSRTQAMFELPMHEATLRTIGQAFLDLADLTRRATAD